jgi:hypothetical protein
LYNPSLGVVKDWTPFPVAYICREDLRGILAEEQIAAFMSDAYLRQCYLKDKKEGQPLVLSSVALFPVYLTKFNLWIQTDTFPQPLQGAILLVMPRRNH